MPVVLVAAAAALLIVFHSSILWSLGAVLEKNEAPRKAEMIVVIGGDYRGNRILKAGRTGPRRLRPQSARQRGGGRCTARHESDLEIDFAVRRDFPRDEFVAFHYPALNTVDEAARRYRRISASWVCTRISWSPAVITPPVPAGFSRGRAKISRYIQFPLRLLYWQNGEWWKNREGRKLWFNETVKTIADWFRI